jgi:hypothetical protein
MKLIDDKMYMNEKLPNPEEPKRMITIELPEKIVRQLETIDEDVAQAIVKLTDTGAQSALLKGSSYEIVEVAPRESVIIVGSDTQLSKIPWLKLVEIAPGRNLIAIPSGTSLESLEVTILDLIENVPADDHMERAFLEEFRKYVGRLRRSRKITKVEILVVDNYDDIGHSS